MRKMPIISGSGTLGKYFSNLVSIVTDLWVYAPTDIMVTYKHIMGVSPVTAWVQKFLDNEPVNPTWRVFPMMIVVVVHAMTMFLLSMPVTIITNTIVTLMTILNLRTFIPADEMLKAELERLNRGE